MDKPGWLEVSLVVNGELAEAVAEVLTRFAPDGVVIESTAVTADAEDEGYAVGPMRVCAYLPTDANLDEVRPKIEQALWYLGRISPLPLPQFKMIQAVDWVEAWKQHYHPLLIGEKLVVLPAWIDEVPSGRLSVRIEPGMAFGTGTHPTTQLCLELAERWVRHGRPVIDVGCGSGILSIAALKLGASQALAVDIDPEALASARQNASLNQMEDRLHLAVGSVAEIRQGHFSISHAPLVFANILAPVLIRLLDEGLAELITAGGSLVFSGILEEQEKDVLEAAQTHGLILRERRQSADWVALCMTDGKREASPNPG